MKKGDIIFVRIDEKIDGVISTKLDYDDHIAYLEKVAQERYFLGGGYVGEPGGMILIHASDIREARDICNKDPLIARGIYRYTIKEWKLEIVSE